VNNNQTLSNDFIWDIYKDRSGVIWVGANGGLNKIDPGRVPFVHYKSIADKKDGLNSKGIFLGIKFIKASPCSYPKNIFFIRIPKN
ncbi:MAG: two-component regulator propeller domain-containing protein, partial [Promethearchaeota archaeon]